MVEIDSQVMSDISAFMQKASYSIDPSQILYVYPDLFRERRVIRIQDRQFEKPRVLKMMPAVGSANRDFKRMQMLINSFTDNKETVLHQITDTNYQILNMPYLGDNVTNGSLGNGTVDLTSLIQEFKRRFTNFANTAGLTHVDLYDDQGNIPRNITFEANYSRLFPVDVEGLVPVDSVTLALNLQQIAKVSSWITSKLSLAS